MYSAVRNRSLTFDLEIDLKSTIASKINAKNKKNGYLPINNNVKKRSWTYDNGDSSVVRINSVLLYDRCI